VVNGLHEFPDVEVLGCKALYDEKYDKGEVDINLIKQQLRSEQLSVRICINDFLLVGLYVNGQFYIVQDMPLSWNPLKQEKVRLLQETDDGQQRTLDEVHEMLLAKECTKYGLDVSFGELWGQNNFLN